MLKQRIITALVLIPLVVLAVFFVPLERFALFVGAVMLLAAWEWTGFIKSFTGIHRASYLFATIILMFTISNQSMPMSYWHNWIFPAELVDWLRVTELSLWTVIIGCLWWMCAFILVLIYPRVSDVIVDNKLLMMLVGWLIILPTWVAITGIRSISYSDEVTRGGGILLFALMLVWAADVGAYFAGKAFGKTKLAVKVSPKKTWEGVFGGIALASLIAVIGVYVLDLWQYSIGLFIIITIMVLSSVVGDLTVSIFKRLSDTKDSGQLLPGHGGILDRIDGVTAAMPICLMGFALLGIN